MINRIHTAFKLCFQCQRAPLHLGSRPLRNALRNRVSLRREKEGVSGASPPVLLRLVAQAADERVPMEESRAEEATANEDLSGHEQAQARTTEHYEHAPLLISCPTTHLIPR